MRGNVQRVGKKRSISNLTFIIASNLVILLKYPEVYIDETCYISAIDSGCNGSHQDSSSGNQNIVKAQATADGK